MSTLSIRALLLASAATLSLSTAGQAADITDAQAKDLAARLRAWMSGLVSQRVPIPAELLSVTPAGENYKIAVPVPATALRMTDAAGQPAGALFTYLVRPIEGTRWRIEGMTLPASIVLAPEAADTLKGAMSVDEAPVAEIRIRSQSASGVYDTAQTTESRLDYRMEGLSYVLRNMGQSGNSNVSVDRLSGTQLLTPSVSGGVDFKVDGMMEGYKTATEHPASGLMRLSARRVVVHMDAPGVMTGQISGLLQNGFALAMDAQAAGGAIQDPKAKRDGALKMMGLLKGLLRGLNVREALEGIDVEVAGQQVSLGKLMLAFGGEAPADRFSAFMEIGLDDLKIPTLPRQFAGLTPRSASMRPSVSNINLKALTALAEAATAPDADTDALQAQLLGLMTNGEVLLGIDVLNVDLGFASLQATGKGTFLSPVSGRAEARIAVTGFDAFMERARALPEAEQAIPALALIKGFGRSEGDKVVWDIRYSETNQLLVNGVDVLKMGAKRK